MDQKRESHHNELLERLLQSVSRSDALTVFFERLWDANRPYWRLFFAHLDILLPPMPIENAKFPFISWVSPNYSARMEKPLESTAALSTAKRDVLVHNFDIFRTELAERLRDLTIFYLMKFVRANPCIRDLINSGDFSYNKVKESLSSTKINLDIFEELAPLKQLGEEEPFTALQATDVSTTDRELASVIAGLSNFPITFFAQPEAVTSMTQALTWDTLLTFHRHFSQYLVGLLHVLDLHHQDYSDIMMEMFNWGLIKTMHSAFWCRNEKHVPFVLASTSQLAPAWHAIKCSTCNQKLILSILYSLDPTIYEALKFKDGLLAVAMAQLLSKNNAKYCFGYKVNGDEIDFLCDSPRGKVIFETKVHRPDVDERQLSQTLKQDLFKLVRKTELLHNSGEKIQQAYLLINLDVNQIKVVIDSVLGSSRIKKVLSPLPCQVSIITPPEVKQVLRELKIIQK